MSDNPVAGQSTEPARVSCGACFATEAKLGRPLLRCGRCRVVGYCNQECQKEHWKNHRSACRQTVKVMDNCRKEDEATADLKPFLPTREQCILSMQNWAAEHNHVLSYFAALSSGILPFQKDSGNIAPSVPVIELCRLDDGTCTVESVGFRQEREVVAMMPSLKGGFAYAKEELKRHASLLPGIASIVISCESEFCLSNYGVPAAYRGKECNLDAASWTSILRVDTAKSDGSGKKADKVIFKLAR